MLCTCSMMLATCPLRIFTTPAECIVPTFAAACEPQSVFIAILYKSLQDCNCIASFSKPRLHSFSCLHVVSAIYLLLRLIAQITHAIQLLVHGSQNATAAAQCMCGDRPAVIDTAMCCCLGTSPRASIGLAHMHVCQGDTQEARNVTNSTYLPCNQHH